MDNKFIQWKSGIKDGIPICLGYFAVSFTFGIMAKKVNLSPSQAVLMSATNYTSAGQFAALGMIGASVSYLEMAVTQLIINLRYCLMSFALSQKIDQKVSLLHRILLAFGITDEIFGVSACKYGEISPFYNYGLMSVAMPGWVLGTLFGIISGGILPLRIISALSIALYAMFIAVIVPPARESRLLSVIILLSMLMSWLFTKIPILSRITIGFKIIGLTVLIAGIVAFLFPIEEDENEK